MQRSINGRPERFRALLGTPGTLAVPGCFDVLSALLLEKVGFESIFLSGYGAAASFLGSPDIGLTPLMETSLIAKNIANAVQLPMIVDADNGYGDEDNVIRTVSELEYAGAAAMIMEDQVLPKRCGHSPNKVILPLDRYIKKLECALKARQTPMVLVARTDAMELDEGVRRVVEFHKAGADVVLIDGLRSLDALKRVGAEVPGHKVINLIHGGKTPLLSVDQLAALGFKIVLYSTPALYVATRAMETAMRDLQQSRDLNSISDRSIAFSDFQTFIEETYVARNMERVKKGVAAMQQIAERMMLPGRGDDCQHPSSATTGARTNVFVESAALNS